MDNWKKETENKCFSRLLWERGKNAENRSAGSGTNVVEGSGDDGRKAIVKEEGSHLGSTV